MRGWRPALRIAWRDAVRHRARSALVLVMIALPVLAVTAAAVVMQTQQLDADEGVERRLGAADAVVYANDPPGPVLQGADPDRGDVYVTDSAPEDAAPFEVDDLARVWGREVRAVGLVTGYAEVRVGDRAVGTYVTETDLTDPLTRGLFHLEDGRWPTHPDEVVINRDLAARGLEIGDPLGVDGSDEPPTIVGIGEDATYYAQPVAMGPIGALGGEIGSPRWLVDAGPVSWADVLAANEAGAYVLSRAVLADPPSAQELPDAQTYDSGPSSETIAVLALVVAMALLEVVLLAGPAFAVGARRQARTLALLAANGGTPRQARRVVLASGVVLGSAAALAGLGLGLVVAWLVLPLVQRFSGEWLGPFEVPWPVVLGVAGFGVLSAFLAAVVPATIASRQDVAAVLAGRRGDRRPSAASPILGAVLLGAGVAGAALGAVNNGAFLIAGSAVVAIFGMILLVPLVVALVARIARRWPLTLRYAARDAARHRTRTGPAVAAVAATVAGVVALGIGASSDERENQETYQPTLAMGDGVMTLYPSYRPASGTSVAPTEQEWREVGALVRSSVDGPVEEILGVPESVEDGLSTGLEFFGPGDVFVDSYGLGISGRLLVSDGPVPPVVDLPADDRARAQEALADGRAVFFVQGTAPEPGRLTVRTYVWDESGGDPQEEHQVSWPATYLALPASAGPLPAIVPTALVEEAGLPVGQVGLHLPDADLSPEEERRLGEEAGALAEGASFYVERGYQYDDEATIVLLVLGVLGAVLVLGGTLTATFLALSDARPDLATLAAVGASPRTRRSVAASYALVVGGVGAVLGAAVGFVPGLAIVRPLTYQQTTGGTTGPFYDVPWVLVLSLVVVLPLLTAGIVWVCARSRLPMAARID